MIQEHLDQALPLVGRLIVQKLPHLAGRRDAADQIEVDAAHEFRVVGLRGRLSFLVLPVLGEALVDSCGERLRWRLIFPGRLRGLTLRRRGRQYQDREK
jgi:hypothetical protein